MAQPWELLIGGFFRALLGGAFGGFGLGMLQGNIWPWFAPGTVFVALVLIVVGVWLLVRGCHLIEVAVHRRLTVGGWSIRRFPRVRS